MLIALCWGGMLASLLLVFNLWPRGMLVICLVCFLSFVSAAQDFSSYQSDGMLLESGAISFFFAPPGFHVDVLEAEPTPGGAARTLELTLPGFLHDFGSAVHPLGAGSPFFSSLPARLWPGVDPLAGCIGASSG